MVCSSSLRYAISVVVMCAGLSGCAELIGDPFEVDTEVDDITSANHGNCSIVSAVATDPPLPFVPAEEFTDSCVRCAKDSCADLAELCMRDATCRAVLTCRARCKDPACIACCGSFMRVGNDFSADFGLPTVAEESALFTSYEKCMAVGNCRGSCGTGLNWECVESSAYRWPKDLRRDLPVQLEVRSAEDFGIVPARVDAYGVGDTEPLDSGETGGWGQLTLNLGARATFNGYFEVVPKDTEFARMLSYSGTLFRPARVSLLGVPAETGAIPDVDHAVVLLGVSDCLGYPASGVSFSLRGIDSKAAYIDGDESLQLDADSTFESGIGIFPPVMTQGQMVRVDAEQGQRAVARASVLIRGGYITDVNLYPISGDGQ
jgi:hypothetical protein